MRSRPLALAFILLGPLACRREGPPAEPQAAEPSTSDPMVWAEAETAASESSPVTATELCDYVASIMIELAPFSAEDMAEFRGKCIKEANDELIRLGSERFQAQAACMMAAKSLDTMHSCDPEAATKESEGICRHVFAIVFRESGVTATDEFDPDLLSACISNLEKERAAMAPEEFIRQRDCILEATEVAQLELCDPP